MTPIASIFPSNFSGERKLNLIWKADMPCWLNCCKMIKTWSKRRRKKEKKKKKEKKRRRSKNKDWYRQDHLWWETNTLLLLAFLIIKKTKFHRDKSTAHAVHAKQISWSHRFSNIMTWSWYKPNHFMTRNICSVAASFPYIKGQIP